MSTPRSGTHLIATPDTLGDRHPQRVRGGDGQHLPARSTRGIKSFGEFKDFAARKNSIRQKHRRVAMFCTGGIRCEKASAYLLSRGFAEVYHLKGGILKYLEGVPEAESRWRGECFVFDDRVALGHGLRESRMEHQSDE